ncbi:alpha-ketoglutarate-dependent dioxygenase AlkB family protein [Aeromonas diversa]|uniref:alpha-ketoglutarate-dependent dioxygenase AlkB family protein n=1 Tax=Aeromonas diversa TaxID=502790 RepID=UPI0039A09D67
MKEVKPDGAALRYWPSWLSEDEQVWWWRWLEENPWQQYTLRLFGRAVPQPRLSLWYGDHAYRYSGLMLPSTPWPEPLARLRDRVSLATSYAFNSVLLNLYRDGSDSIGWHSDDESELGPAPAVATVTLGECRPLLLRRVSDHSCREARWLQPGSLLLMAPGVQSQWQHSLPKTRRSVGPRISLTFRLLHPGR